MKSLIVFLQLVLQDLEGWCQTCTLKDRKTILKRIEDEGLSFLTITLANFGKDFEQALDQGFVGSDQFSSFSRSGGLPKFLSGFLSQVFDRRTGRLLNVPDVTAIWAVRQLTLMWAKINIPCTPARDAAAIRRYMECEYELEAVERRYESDFERRLAFRRVSRLLWSRMFNDVDRKIYDGEIIPKHGPGSTADQLLGNEKWDQREWPRRLEYAGLPSWEYLYPNWNPLVEDSSTVELIEPGAERPVRVITVPKTQKTPRIIAMEPAVMQYVQQGVHAVLREAIEADDIASYLVSYARQEPNQLLAHRGSRDGNLATLDLSEASDRVLYQHVMDLLYLHPHLREVVDASRSTKADVFGARIDPLIKFASMGSALCFPMEALVFMTVIFLGIEKSLNRPVTLKDIYDLRGLVRVYGDDIIVPVDYVKTVVDELENFGFLVNHNKSFWTGKFRESCGKEYYAGDDVSIVRLRSMLPSRRQHTSEIVSTVETSNLLYKAGMWESASYLLELTRKLLPVPVVGDESPMLGATCFQGIEPPSKWDKFLHHPIVKGGRVTARIPDSHLEGKGALLKWFSIRGELPIPDEDHLRRAGRPLAVDIKLGYGPAI